MKRISFLLALFVMISAATFANTTHLIVMKSENSFGRKSPVHLVTEELKRATSCTVTVTAVAANGTSYMITATYSCSDCTSQTACAGAYAVATSTQP